MRKISKNILVVLLALLFFVSIFSVNIDSQIVSATSIEDQMNETVISTDKNQEQTSTDQDIQEPMESNSSDISTMNQISVEEQPDEKENQEQNDSKSLLDEANKAKQSLDDQESLPVDDKKIETETITATLIIEGSKILQDKSEHDTAHEVWFKKIVEVQEDTAFIDFLYDTLNEDPKLITLDVDKDSGWLTTIEISGYEANTTGKTNGSASSWMWYVKHQDSQDFVSVSTLDRKDEAAYLNDGDTLKLKFINDPRYPTSVRAETPENPIELKDDSNPRDWTGFRGDAENKTPVREIEIAPPIVRAENWAHINTNVNEWGFPTSISDLLTINGYTYYATADQLIKLDPVGNVDSTLTLAGGIQYFSRIAYARGVIIVPLQGGAVQAVDPETMTSLWVVESLDSFEKWEPQADSDEWKQNFYDLQSLGSTYIDIQNGITYIPLTASKFPSSTAGVIRAIDISTGKEIWRHNNYETGYYWSGVTEIGDYLLIGNDKGSIEILDKEGNFVKESKPFSENYGVRSTLTQQDGSLYFVTQDGVFHSIKFDPATLDFSNHESVKFATNSTSTPTIHNGKAYVGGVGGAGDWGDPGVFAVINLTTMTIEFLKDDVAGEVKSAPLVIYDQEGEIYAYFTANTEDGLLYVYHDGAVEIAYRPTAEQAQYTTATPIIDANGNIYYTTDQAIISLVADKQGELNEYILNTSIDPQIGVLSVTINEDDVGFTQHSIFEVTDVTENVKSLYDQDIKAETNDAKYVAFRTSFTGAATANPNITAEIKVSNSYLPLEGNQSYKLYRLEGDKLVELSLEEATTALLPNRSMTIMPLLATKIAGGGQSSNTIQFTQKLQDSITYVLAAVPEQQSVSSQTTPEGSASQPQTKQQTATAKTNTHAIAKTGEVQYVIPIAVLAGIALISVITKKKIEKREK